MAISSTRPSLKELKDSWQNRSYPDEEPAVRSLRDPRVWTWIDKPLESGNPVRLTDLRGMAGGCMYEQDSNNRNAQLPTVWAYANPLAEWNSERDVSNFGGASGIIRTGCEMGDNWNDYGTEVRLYAYVLPGQSGTYNVSFSGAWHEYKNSWGASCHGQFTCVGHTDNYLSGSSSMHYYIDANNSALSLNQNVTLSDQYPFVSFIFYVILKANPSDSSSKLPRRVQDFTNFRCVKV